MVKRTSLSLCMASLVSMMSLLEAGLGLRIWFERVPSKSNPADLPSRNEVEETKELFGCEDRGDIRLTEMMEQFLFEMTFGPRHSFAILQALKTEAKLFAAASARVETNCE